MAIAIPLDRKPDRNPFSRAAVALLAAAVAASLALLGIGPRWSLLPPAVLFGWSQLGGA